MDMTLQSEPNPAILFAKLAKIMGTLKRLGKSGHNQLQRYDFVTDADVLDTLRPLLSESNIALFSSMVDKDLRDAGKTEKGAPKTHAVITFQFTLCCGDTGVTYTSNWTGEAIDSGDKSISKAATSALKYWLLKTFMLSTGDPSDDADNESPEYSKPTPPPPQKAPPAPTGNTASTSNEAVQGQQSQSAGTGLKTPNNGTSEKKGDTDKIGHVWHHGDQRQFDVTHLETKMRKMALASI